MKHLVSSSSCCYIALAASIVSTWRAQSQAGLRKRAYCPGGIGFLSKSEY